MSKIIPTFLFAWICLSLVGYFLYIGTVESDLHARSKEAASSAGYEWLSISQQGRDLTLHGSVSDEDSLIDAVNIVRNVYGVRVVQTGEISNELPDQALLETKNNDRDSDGVIDTLDVFPDDVSEQLDHDADGVGDNADLDDDNDGVNDTNDAFPLDVSETVDTDNDGIGNNADTDDDNDGYSDSIDAFALKLSEYLDSDGDGIGDNKDVDDDNDGIKDHLDAFPYTHASISDIDGDGVTDSQDIYPNDDSRWSNEQIEVSVVTNSQSSYNPCNIDIGSVNSRTMIYFQAGSPIVDNEGIELLRKLAALLNNCPFYFVNITGHTDLRGSQLMNQRLSEQRASNVETQLIEFGVNHERIDTSGVAASFPVSDNMTIDGLAGNRRVEITLTQ